MTIVQHLLPILPEGFYAEPRVRLGVNFETDVGTTDTRDAANHSGGGGAAPQTQTAVAPAPTWTTEADVDAVWQWLVQRYRDCAWLDRDGHHFAATLGDETFADTYFDEPQLRMLAWNSGVRHRQDAVAET